MHISPAVSQGLYTYNALPRRRGQRYLVSRTTAGEAELRTLVHTTHWFSPELCSVSTRTDCRPGIDKTVFRSPQDRRVAICRVGLRVRSANTWAIVGLECVAGCPLMP